MIRPGQVLTSIIHRRIMKENKNFLATFTGKTGSGKSYSCLFTGEDYYKQKLNQEFPVENVCFSIKEFIERIQFIKKHNLKGQIVILEEAGVNIGSLDFNSKLVKIFNYILQSFRSLNICVLLNLPGFHMMSKQARELMHMKITTIEIDKKNKAVKLNAKWIQINEQSGKTYWHKPMVKIGKEMVKLDYLMAGMPSQKLIEAYEGKKSDFLDTLLKESMDKLQKPKKELTALQERVGLLIAQGYSRKEMAQILSIDMSTISEHYSMAKKKGWTAQDFKELLEKKLKEDKNPKNPKDLGFHAF